MLRRWRDYLNKTRETHDPVFAAWNAFAGVPADQFAAKASEVEASLPADETRKSKGPWKSPLPTHWRMSLRRTVTFSRNSMSREVNPDPNRESLRLVLALTEPPPMFCWKTSSRFVEMAGMTTSWAA